MIALFIKNKFKFLLISHKNPWRILLTILLLATAFAYGLMYGVLSNKIETGEITLISENEFMNYALLMIAVITVVRMIFPSYTPLKNIFPNYYPVSKIQKYVASVADDLIHPYFLYLTTFVVVGSLFKTQNGLSFFYLGMMTLIISHFIRRSIQYMIDFKISRSSQIMFIISIFSFIGYMLWLGSIKYPGDLLPLFLFILTGFFQDRSIYELKTSNDQGLFGIRNHYWQLLINNKQARLTLIVGLVLKLALLTSDVIMLNIKGKHVTLDIVLVLFTSPLVVFTYVFNNMWGFWKNVWLNFELRTADYKALMKEGLRLLKVPISIDIVISFTYIVLAHPDILFGLTFYFTVASFLIMMAFFWSLFTPKKIETTFQMKGSTSPLSIIVAVSGVYALSTMKMNPLLYGLIPVFLGIGVLAIVFSVKNYRAKKYTVVRRLMK